MSFARAATRVLFGSERATPNKKKLKNVEKEKKKMGEGGTGGCVKGYPANFSFSKLKLIN